MSNIFVNARFRKVDALVLTFIKNQMIQGLFQLFAKECQQTKMQDSIPTNASQTEVQASRRGFLEKHISICQEEQIEIEGEKCVDKVMRWFKSRGIIAGDPEQLINQHRVQQKKNIILLMGRKECKVRKCLPSLLVRRLSSRQSKQFLN